MTDLYNPNDNAHNTNQRIPPLTLPGQYPYVLMEQYRSGNWWREDSTPGNESFSRGHLTGTFHEHNVLGGIKSLVANCSHFYSIGGMTNTTDKNSHDKVGGSHVNQISGDKYEEHFNDSMFAIGKNLIKLNGGAKFEHTTGKVEHTSTEDWVTDHNHGNHHHNVDGDHVQYTGNNKYDYIGGEKGTYLPNGNYDVSLDKGKFQILNKANTINIQAAQDITITSSTNIILKVGSSTIQITSSSITITSPQVNFVQS